MAATTLTKLRIKSGSLELEFEGTETFLRSEVPKLVKAVRDLQSSEVSASAGVLKRELKESRRIEADIGKHIEQIKKDLGSMSELGEVESLRLQMALDRLSKLMSTLSNLLKKMSDTANSIVQNLK